MTKLGVNIDHVATIREARRAPEPDPIAAAVLAELAGAHGITVHLRGDRRHISERDVALLRQIIKTRLNVEMANTEEMVSIALEMRPDTVTLVPEKEDEVTTEGGLDVVGSFESLKRTTGRLQEAGLEVSLFVDPVGDQIQKAAESGATLIEINTAGYAQAVPLGLKEEAEEYLAELHKVKRAAAQANQFDLRVLAGHGLTYRNVGPISEIPQIEELNIGHNIVARAVLVGMERAVGEMLIAMGG